MPRASSPGMRCIVIGGGISGLALGYQLVRRGIEPIILERAGRAGGVIRSEREGTYLWEGGPASVRLTPALSELLRELGLEDRVLTASPAARKRWVLAGGEAFPVPETARDFARTPMLPTRAKLRALCDLVLPRGPAAHGGDESVAQMTTRRLGKTAAERLLFPLLSALYAADPTTLSVTHGFGWLAEIERSHRSLLLARMRGALPPDDDRLVSFPDGMAELTRALAARLDGAVHLGTPVRRVEATAGGYRVATDGAEWSAPAIALALPAPAAADVVAPVDAALADSLRAIRYARVSVVHLAYPREACPRFVSAYGLYAAPGEAGWFAGAVFPSQLFPHRAPANEVSVLVRLGGARNPEIAGLPDPLQLGIAEHALASTLGAHEPPSRAHVARHDQALPLYELGHGERVEAIEQAERRHPGLFVTSSARHGVSVPSCVAAATRAADQIARFLAA